VTGQGYFFQAFEAGTRSIWNEDEISGEETTACKIGKPEVKVAVPQIDTTASIRL
jgi:hypothetical protein